MNEKKNAKLEIEIWRNIVLLKHRKILCRYGASRASKSPKINKNASRPNGLFLLMACLLKIAARRLHTIYVSNKQIPKAFWD